MNNIEFRNLITQRHAIWPNSDDAQLIWKFTEYRNPLMPFRVFGCEMNGFGLTSIGYGTSWNRDEAIDKAFGEAWERLWLLKFNRSRPHEVPVTSSGFAAGLNLEESARAARQEKIERAVLLFAWSEKFGWSKSHCHSLRSYPLIAYLKLIGWTTNFFLLQSNMGAVRACLLRHKSKGAFFDSAFAQNFSNSDEKLILSVVKNVLAMKPTDAQNFPDVGVPLDHEIFYSLPSNLEAFEFLDSVSSRPETKIELQSPQLLIAEAVVNEPRFPAVSRASHPDWPELSWGRQSIRGANRWPHPLA